MRRMPPYAESEKYHIANGDFCEQLLNNRPDLCKYDIRKIVRDFNQLIMFRMINSRDGIALPLFIGNIFLGCFPNKDNKFKNRLEQERKRTPQYTYTIDNQDGFSKRIFYTTVMVASRFEEGKFWGFVPQKDMDILAKEAFVNDWKKYAVVHNRKHMYDIFNCNRRARNIATAKRMTQEQLKTYNEFEFDS